MFFHWQDLALSGFAWETVSLFQVFELIVMITENASIPDRKLWNTLYHKVLKFYLHWQPTWFTNILALRISRSAPCSLEIRLESENTHVLISFCCSALQRKYLHTSWPFPRADSCFGWEVVSSSMLQEEQPLVLRISRPNLTLSTRGFVFPDRADTLYWRLSLKLLCRGGLSRVRIHVSVFVTSQEKKFSLSTQSVSLRWSRSTGLGACTKDWLLLLPNQGPDPC